MVELLGYLISDFEQKEQKANEEAQRILLEHQSRMLSKPQDRQQAKANEKFIKALQKQIQRRTTDEESGRSMLGTSNNNVIGTNDWSDFDRLKSLENR